MNLHLDSMEVERLYSSLLIKKGRNHQINYFKTEIFELMSEIVKLNCNDSKKDTINQEIADFLIKRSHNRFSRIK